MSRSLRTRDAVGGRSRVMVLVGTLRDAGLRTDLAGGAAVMVALWSNAVGCPPGLGLRAVVSSSDLLCRARRSLARPQSVASVRRFDVTGAAEPAGPGVVSGGGQVLRRLSARQGRPPRRAHPAEPAKPVICRKWSSMWKWSSKNSASSAAIWPTGTHSACRASSSACTAGRGAVPRSK